MHNPRSRFWLLLGDTHAAAVDTRVLDAHPVCNTHPPHSILTHVSCRVLPLLNNTRRHGRGLCVEELRDDVAVLLPQPVSGRRRLAAHQDLWPRHLASVICNLITDFATWLALLRDVFVCLCACVCMRVCVLRGVKPCLRDVWLKRRRSCGVGVWRGARSCAAPHLGSCALDGRFEAGRTQQQAPRDFSYVAGTGAVRACAVRVCVCARLAGIGSYGRWVRDCRRRGPRTWIKQAHCGRLEAKECIE